MILQGKLDRSLTSDDICLCQNWKCVDTVRLLYQDLLCLGVSTNTGEEVIRKCVQLAEGRG